MGENDNYSTSLCDWSLGISLVCMLVSNSLSTYITETIERINKMFDMMNCDVCDVQMMPTYFEFSKFQDDLFMVK